ncbi:MAG TPA: peptidylprolyl isomerase [Bacteroidales bacterium]|nr:peptidylprolyl isomerase [Bacteroidales bacterium]HOM40766.1 peptidylprolyl isomerase [Bacteroidales bacterium]HPP92477.1 peptidylprolyl isomerase [Bacteroidales bacterium]HRR15942.1 peptidylprolyl isomerase [Bacteroidales bacterium]HRT47293.1 peptidylprolyl isomerase [Bacteroidales bacterium]
MKYRLSIILMVIATGLLHAQGIQDSILLIAGGREVTAGEFMRMYRKIYNPSDTGDFNNYLEQFIVFKLKVADAISKGYDTTKAFRTELQGYRDQVAKNYLTDKNVKEEILKKSYEKTLKEINAWHILVSCPPNSSPEDTLAAFKKALEIRARIISGEPFEQVARSASDDPSAIYNGGNLGYITTFQMITPFEEAVYSMKKGELSNPVRTPYGYHIIKVADIRPSRGKIKVAHIMRSVPPNAPEQVAKAAEDTIKYVYKKLLEGASFSDLAMKYSDHKESAARGGELNWFGAGEIISEFAEAAFSLEKNGDFTPPVKTIYGWHIIKRLDKKDPPSYEEARSQLESKIDETWLNSLATRSMVNSLKQEYKFRLNTTALNWFLENTDTLIIRGLSKYDRGAIPSGTLYTFDGQKFSNVDFARYIESRASSNNTEEPANFVNKLAETCITDHILRYENSLLEKKYPEFRYLVNEFHDGILLFEISKEKIWDRAQNDTSGLKKYYEENKQRYPGKKSFTGMIYVCMEKAKAGKFYKAARKYVKKPDFEKKLQAMFNAGSDTIIKVYKGVFQEGDSLLPENLKWEEGLHETEIKGFPSVIVITKINPASPLPLNEVMGEISSEYQNFLESEWIKQLKEKYPVRINRTILEQVKNELQK